jgi:hypothetical protein
MLSKTILKHSNFGNTRTLRASVSTTVFIKTRFQSSNILILFYSTYVVWNYNNICVTELATALSFLTIPLKIKYVGRRVKGFSFVIKNNVFNRLKVVGKILQKKNI